jgi:hypothetical protein
MKLRLGLAAALAAILIVLPVSAGRPAHAAPQPPSGTITLDQADPHLGDWVTFTWATTGLKGNQHPRIQIMCYQSSALVYGEAGPATQSFLLGGASSAWLYVGGPAECIATLYYWDWHPVQTFVPLASIGFAAGG